MALLNEVDLGQPSVNGREPARLILGRPDDPPEKTAAMRGRIQVKVGGAACCDGTEAAGAEAGVNKAAPPFNAAAGGEARPGGPEDDEEVPT